MTDHRDECQVLATWTMRAVSIVSIANAGPHLELRERLAESGDTAAALFTPPPRSAPVSAESREAFVTGVRDGLPMLLREDGVVVERTVPLLFSHQVRIIDDLEIERTGDSFTGRGWISAGAAELLRKHDVDGVSPGFRIDACRLVERGDGERFVDVEAWTIYELSATADPLEPDTTLIVGELGVEWLTDPTPAPTVSAGFAEPEQAPRPAEVVRFAEPSPAPGCEQPDAVPWSVADVGQPLPPGRAIYRPRRPPS